MDAYIRKTTYEEFKAGKDRKKELCAKKIGQEYANKLYETKDDKRLATLISFPYSLVLEGYTPALDMCNNWCWETFGSPQTELCAEEYSEYPGCPLVKATKVITIIDGFEDVTYKSPGKHNHQGTWASASLGKSGYDIFYCEYYFKESSQLEQFSDIVLTLGLGYKYEV